MPKRNDRLKRLGFFILSLGIDPRKTLRSLQSVVYFWRSYRTFRKSSDEPCVLSPILGEHLEQSGMLSNEYFALDLWAARQAHNLSPTEHLDIGSRIDGFVAHVLSWRSLDVLDVRPLESNVEGLTFLKDDARSLTSVATDSYDLVSSLHAIEHFGLGRYGDDIDPKGHLAAIDSMVRVTRDGGHMLLGFPVGDGTVQFNAQRLLYLPEILQRIPGKVLRMVRTTANGGIEDLKEVPTTGYSCIGLLVRLSK